MKRRRGREDKPKGVCKFFISKMESKIVKMTSSERIIFPSYLNYDSKLIITLHGEPIADSRPRVVRGIAFSKNIGILRGHFAPLYDRDELLKNTIIDSPFHLGFRFYMTPSKKLCTKLGHGKKARPKNKKLYEMFLKDRIHDMSIKDCDNMVKVYNDLFMTERSRITLDDGFNIGLSHVDKFISLNPRTEITIYFSSNPIGYFKDLMHDHYSYFKFRMSEKHMYMYKRNFKQQLQFLDGLFNVEFKEVTSPTDIVNKLKQVLTYMEENYSATLIYELVRAIGDMKDYKKMNRTVHINILMMYLFRRNKVAHKILCNTMSKYEKMISGGEEW